MPQYHCSYGGYFNVGNIGNKQVNIYGDMNSININLKGGNLKICSWLM